MDTLTPDQIRTALDELDGWSYADDAIHREYGFDTFLDAIAFINQVAAKADAADHHPDITNSYTSVTLTLSTHSAGGVTDKDLDLARRIDELS
jgi:4a-hydroxytetrahydrobiopterin dehydratase